MSTESHGVTDFDPAVVIGINERVLLVGNRELAGGIVVLVEGENRQFLGIGSFAKIAGSLDIRKVDVGREVGSVMSPVAIGLRPAPTPSAQEYQWPSNSRVPRHDTIKNMPWTTKSRVPRMSTTRITNTGP